MNILIYYLRCIVLYFLCFTCYTSLGAVIQLDSSNVEGELAKYELVFVNFYADWCHYSRMLQPIFEESSDSIANGLGKDGRIAFGRVDCVSQGPLCLQYRVSKYPTLKAFRYGELLRKEYRGARSKEAFEEYLKEQLIDRLKIIDSEATFQYEEGKNYIFGYYSMASTDPTDLSHLKLFKSFSTSLGSGSSCEFCLIDISTRNHTQPDKLAFVSSKSPQSKDFYPGSKMDDRPAIKQWIYSHCVPLVQELNFQNAEELTEEGLPFVILFHRSDDTASMEQFTKTCEAHMAGQSGKVKFLTAKGELFMHPLMHLGKSLSDLPIIAIDSFKHMFIYPHDVKMAFSNPLSLNQFIEDLHSGKLHREFHYGPDPTQPPSPQLAENSHQEHPGAEKTQPPESIFIKLAPSPTRYSIIKDEL